MRYRIFYFFSISMVFLFLIYFSQKRNSKNKILNLSVNFKGGKGRFLDSEMVNKLLIQREDTTFFLREEILDLKLVEDKLTSNAMIANADIFRTPQGILNVRLEERKPIVRIINNQEEFYLDNFGYKVPLSKKHSPRVPIFYGNTGENLTSLVNFVKLIKSDSFAKIEIIDIRHYSKSYVIGIRSFPFKVVWGDNSKFKNKIKKLKYLYSYLDGKEFLKIDQVNLTFDKQIVIGYEKS